MTRHFPALELAGERAELERALVLLQEYGCLGTEESETAQWQAFFPQGTNLREISRGLERDHPEVAYRALPDVIEQDWHASWRSRLRGFGVGDSLFLLPSWRDAPTVPGRNILKIDPERAFGTGSHDTTRLCLEILERELRSDRPRGSAIDVGCGTGILAMACAIWGAEPVLAIEPDPDARACAQTNIVRNQLDSRIELYEGGWQEVIPHPASIVVANLNAAVLREALPRLSTWMLEAGRLVLSGILVEEVDELAAGLAPPLVVAEEWSAGEWSALVIRKSPQLPRSAKARSGQPSGEEPRGTDESPQLPRSAKARSGQPSGEEPRGTDEIPQLPRSAKAQSGQPSGEEP